MMAGNLRRTRSLRFAILDNEDSEKWKGYTESLWREAFAEQSGDSFEVFSCFRDEFPDPSTIESKYDVIIVGGSHYSAYEEISWIRTLEDRLREYVTRNVRILACCFGHQVLAKALGGIVGKNPSARFVLGLEKIQVNALNLRNLGLCQGSESPENVEICLNVVQSHGDQVLQAPANATILASSGTAAYEMLAYGDNVISFQFHPEAPPKLFYEKIWTALTASGRLDATEAAAAEEGLLRGNVDTSAALAMLCRFAENQKSVADSTQQLTRSKTNDQN